jgi:Trypsin-like peptidase domain
MLAIDDIVASVRASRAEFGRLFLEAQVGTVSAQRVAFEAVAASAAGGDAGSFTAALRYAQAQGWLEPLVHAIVDEGREDGRIAQALMTEKAAGDATLQAMANVAAGFPQPEVIYRGYASVRHWTVKVLVDGAASGSGILIGPNLVLTAWHVVKPLFAPKPGGGWDWDRTAAPRLQAEFDDFLAFVRPGGALAPNATARIKAHPQWCVIFSRCHDEELQSRLPNDLTQLEGQWDYVIFRLEKAPGQERRWASLDARAVVPRAQSPIVVFQHPAGQPMRIGQGDILKPDQNAAAAIPRLRFLHGANTVQGSSGGPCFDTAFMLFGFHQGEWAGTGGNGHPMNRGIPLARVLEHIKAEIQNLPTPDPSEMPIWQLGRVRPSEQPDPIIGCDTFQTVVWRSAIAGKPKVVLINGDHAGCGKSFRLAVLSAMLPDAGHLKILLTADQISKMPAARLAEVICQTAGAAPPAIVPVAEYDSTTTTWLKDEVVRKTVAALDAVRNGRLVWLLLSELNKSEIQGEHASPFLFLLYEQAATLDWLRVMLDGMRGDVPATIKDVSERHRVPPVTLGDIATFLRRAVAELDVQSEAGVRVAAKQAQRDLDAAIAADPSTAMKTLSVRAQSIVQDYIDEVESGGNGG